MTASLILSGALIFFGGVCMSSATYQIRSISAAHSACRVAYHLSILVMLIICYFHRHSSLFALHLPSQIIRSICKCSSCRPVPNPLVLQISFRLRLSPQHRLYSISQMALLSAGPHQISRKARLRHLTTPLLPLSLPSLPVPYHLRAVALYHCITSKHTT